jgi:hypothetical protein
MRSIGALVCVLSLEGPPSAADAVSRATSGPHQCDLCAVLEPSRAPCHADRRTTGLKRLGRLLLSSSKIVKSQRNTTVPPVDNMAEPGSR